MVQVVDRPITHFTPVDNLPGVLKRGCLLADSVVQSVSMDIRECGDVDIKQRRRVMPVRVAPYGYVGDYVPFYFAPRSPMMYKIWRGGVPTYTHGQEVLVYLWSSLSEVRRAGLPWVGSDGNCAVAVTQHTNNWAELEQLVDWDLMKEQYWNNTQDDGDRMRRRMAEILVHNSFPLGSVRGIVVHNQAVERVVRQLVDDAFQVAVRPGWYY